MERKDAVALALIAILLAAGFAGVGLVNLLRGGASGLALTGGCLGLALLCLLAAGWMMRPPRERGSSRSDAALAGTTGRPRAGGSAARAMPRDVQRIIDDLDRTKRAAPAGDQPTAGRV